MIRTNLESGSRNDGNSEMNENRSGKRSAMELKTSLESLNRIDACSQSEEPELIAKSE